MKKVNWVVAGIGDIARRRVLPAIMAEPRSTLYGLVTRDAAKAEAWPGVRVWSTVEEAVTDPAIDVVYAALPTVLHAPAALAALRAGKHVLAEKPMAIDDEQAERMVAEAHRSQRLLGAAYYRRHYPKLIRAKQLIAEGAIGQPLLAEANCHSWLDAGGPSWMLDPAMAGGGPLWTTAPHRIDALHFLFGKSLQVRGFLSNAVRGLAVEDSATVLLKFAGGVHGVVDVRWNSHERRDQFRILGTDGEIGLDPLNGPELRVAGRLEILHMPQNPHLLLIENFVDVLLAGGRSEMLTCPGEQGRWVDWAIEQVARSQNS